jgi:glycosyltransferase involved in cell wall biosynthesis
VRIVQVTPYFHPHAGGVESHVRSLAREFTHEGHDVTIVTSRFRRTLPAEETYEGYRILRSPTLAVWFNTPIDYGTVRTLRSLDADVFHLHYPPPLTSFFATRALGRSPVPVVLTYHCDLFLDRPAGPIAWLYQRTFLPPTLREVRRIIVHTQSYGRTSANLRGRDLAIIPSVVDLDRFRPGLDADDLRSKLGLEGKHVLAFTGRLVPHKGVEVILRALRELPSDVVLLVIGVGPRYRSLVAQARRFGVESRVRFCSDVSDDDLPRYLCLADVFVFPSQNRLEGFGLAVAEAMAAGLPVVIADVPGVREVIEDGKEGLLAEPLLSSDFAAKVRRLLDDPALRRSMAVAARHRAEARYGLANVAGQLIRLYEGLRAVD